MFKGLKSSSKIKEMFWQINLSGKMVLDNKVQAATIILTYCDINEDIRVLLVRNHPLTRGASSDISRPFHQFFDIDNVIPAFQFPGGSINANDANISEWKRLISQNKNLFDWVHDDVTRSLIVGAIRELHEETTLSFNRMPQASDAYFKRITYEDKKDATRDFWVRVHVFHWHLGKLNNADINLLHQTLQPGHDICAALWYPIIAITKYVKNNQEIFSLTPNESVSYKITHPLNGLHHSYYSDKYTLEELNRYVALLANNIAWLSLCFPVAFRNYQQSNIIMESEFERIKPIGSGTHDTQLCKHVPTNNYYVLKYIKPKSELDKQIQANAKEMQLDVVSAEEDIARNELLAAELYQLHGILVPKLQLVKTPVGFIIASQFQADYKEDNFLLETSPPENLFDGVGCDLAFANYDAIGNVYKLKFFNQATLYHRPYNAGFIKNNTEVIRIDVGGSLRYRAKGALKSMLDFSDNVDIDFAFRKDINPGFYNVYASQMTNERWMRAKQRLERVTNEQRTACVFRFAYGSDQQKQALADRINNRVVTTIKAIDKNINSIIIPEKVLN